MQLDDYFTIGFMDYPNNSHRPQPGTEAEIRYSRGWIKGQKAASNPLEFNLDEPDGRDTYAAEYR